MKALKAWFLSLRGGERGLLTTLLVLGAVTATVLFVRRAGADWRRDSSLLARLRQQQVVLDSRDAVEKRARDASAKLVPGESLSQVQLQSRVNELARQAGIGSNSLQISNLPDNNTAGANLLLHSIRLSLTGVAWNPLRSFYTEILKKRPYIAIEEMTVNMPDQRTGLHNVQMKLSSIEVLQ